MSLFVLAKAVNPCYRWAVLDSENNVVLCTGEPYCLSDSWNDTARTAVSIPAAMLDPSIIENLQTDVPANLEYVRRYCLDSSRKSHPLISKEVRSVYPYNLLEAIFKEVWPEELDADQKEGLNYALSSLSEHERTILAQRFQNGLTLEQVGKEFNVTRERIRQIEAKALRKLRHPTYSNAIRKGLVAARGETKKRLESSYESEIQTAILEKKAELERINAAESEADLDLQAVQTPIDSLNLTVRPYNALARVGISTVEELSGKTRKELMKIRNLGITSLNEIIEKLGQKGIQLKEE